jgi:hypothetical protein
MWDNLVECSDPNGQGVPTVGLPHVVQIRPTITTCQGLGRLGPNYTRHAPLLPKASQQADVIDRLFGWFIGHAQRKLAAMTSKPSVQDEVHEQIIKPLNMLLEVCVLLFANGSPWVDTYSRLATSPEIGL